jgi:hypothetical protein
MTQSYTSFAPAATPWGLTEIRATPEKTGFIFEYKLEAQAFDAVAVDAMYALAAKIASQTHYQNALRFVFDPAAATRPLAGEAACK